MDNKNQPVYPIMNKEFMRPEDESKGLTKLELASFMAMQGFISKQGSDIQNIPKMALAHAKALLDLLDKEPK